MYTPLKRTPNDNGKIPSTDAAILNILSEAKKAGSTQYEKYVHTIKALSLVADKL